MTILRKAYDHGINYFDTAHIYTDSEEKLGLDLHDVRENIILSSKAMMKKIGDCLNCGRCKSICPYGLDTPALLKKNYEDYKTFL